MLDYCVEGDKWVLTNLSDDWQFNTLILQSHELVQLRHDGCIHSFTTGYTTVDAMLEIGIRSATVE